MILDNKSDKSNNFSTSSSQLTTEVKLKRKEIKYEDLSARFIYLEKDFKKQFAHIYSGRLMQMKERVIESCFRKWGKDTPICKLSELSGETDKKCVIIGTLFKHQELKPSILKELSEENQIVPQPPRSNFVSDDDVLILEDEIQRIRLLGQFDIKKYVTGIVIGLLGFENEGGKFEVQDMCFACPKVSLEKPLALNDDSYVVIVSGLEIGSPESALAVELFIDSIKGDLGSVKDQENWAKVSRILIAGNSIATSSLVPDFYESNAEGEQIIRVLTALKELDIILVDLVKTVEVDFMPGEFDPTNHILPQQAVYDCVFPQASQYESFHCVTNPYECKLEGRRILGTSGQPIKNIKALTDIDQSLEILEKTLIWGHLAPTAPDTLACYPYYNEDPFIIHEQPDIYFAGNQPEFQTKIFNGNGQETRIISIPSFCTTQTCVLVNLKTLDCTPIKFTT